MRSLETSLMLVDVGVLIWFLTGRASRGLIRVLSATAILVMAVQILVEGHRWQMYPAYLVTVWLALSSTWPRKRRLAVSASLAGMGCLLASAVLCLVLPVFELPQPTGPFKIGSVTRHLVDTSRVDLFGNGPGAHRELMVEVWYPAQGYGPARYYCSRSEMPFKKEQLALVRTHAAEGVPIAGTPGRYPVLIFSPSWQGRRYQNTFQFEDLASHGFVVVAMDHPYGTELVVLPGGRNVKTKLGDWIDFSSAKALEASLRVDEGELQVRTADVRFVLDTLERLDRHDPTGLLTGHLDLSRVGIFGHSFGGAVAAEACRVDHRFQAGIDLDGCLFGDVAKKGIEQPFLFITGEGRPAESIPLMGSQDPRSLAQAFYHQDASNVRDSLVKYGGYILHIRGASHMSYCDSPLFSPIRRLTGAGPIKASRGMSIVNKYTLAFFNRYLNGQSEAVLQGPAREFPEARLEVWQRREREFTLHSSGLPREVTRSGDIAFDTSIATRRSDRGE